MTDRWLMLPVRFVNTKCYCGSRAFPRLRNRPSWLFGKFRSAVNLRRCWARKTIRVMREVTSRREAKRRRFVSGNVNTLSPTLGRGISRKKSPKKAQSRKKAQAANVWIKQLASNVWEKRGGKLSKNGSRKLKRCIGWSNIFPRIDSYDHGYKFPVEFCRSHVIPRTSLFNPQERAADGKVTASSGTF